MATRHITVPSLDRSPQPRRWSVWGFEWVVATRFLMEGKFQSILILVGVAAGVAVVAYISALVSGLQKNTLEKTLGTQAHIVVTWPEERVLSARPKTPGAWQWQTTQPKAQRVQGLVNWMALMQTLDQDSDVRAVSPSASGSALAWRGEVNKAVALLGVDFERYDAVAQITGKIQQGQGRLAPGDIMIGTLLASDLGLAVGDKLKLSTGERAEDLSIVAVVDFGLRDLNRRHVLVPLRSAQTLLGLPGGVTQLDVTVHDVYRAQTVADRWARNLPYKIDAWQTTNAQLVSALNAQSVSTAIIRSVVMVVVILGIASVLVVSVVQKQREIGILRAMGCRQAQILRVFLLQGAIFGLVGSVLGVVLAWAMIWAFTHFVKGADGLPLFSIGMSLEVAWKVSLGASLAGVLAAVMPARRAAAMDPAQAIRL